ncbi:expressed unknown protein [Seminavis robusta]|uniref:Uncharacterized protein n=1 Tax=Seminavis robusta TaxID=568900 RepID=A0A9N8D8M5_9STRA|nr:expressed unknown protein [Seminavis robusta]|eukprot:Sro16_g011860.1 n/a (156) ;mRNA; f:143727-144194
MNLASLVLLLIAAVLLGDKTVSANTNDTLLDDTLAHAGHQERQYDRRELGRCIRREMMDLQNMMDDVARQDKFRKSPEYQAKIHAFNKHSNELYQVTQVFTACQEEVESGRSAVGTGAMVGIFLAQSDKEPITNPSPPGPSQCKASTTPMEAPTK